jgi:hypothetical protein
MECYKIWQTCTHFQYNKFTQTCQSGTSVGGYNVLDSSYLSGPVFCDYIKSKLWYFMDIKTESKMYIGNVFTIYETNIFITIYNITNLMRMVVFLWAEYPNWLFYFNLIYIFRVYFFLTTGSLPLRRSNNFSRINWKKLLFFVMKSWKTNQAIIFSPKYEFLFSWMFFWL